MVWIERDFKRTSGSNSPGRETFQTRLLNNWPSLSTCHSCIRRISTLECCFVSLIITYLVDDVYEFPICPFSAFGLHLLTKEILEFIFPLWISYLCFSTHWSTKTKLALNMYVLHVVLNTGSCLVQTGAWDIYYPCSQQLHEANIFLITAPWSENIPNKESLWCWDRLSMLACIRKAKASSCWIIFPWMRSCLPWGESHDRDMILPS